MKYDAAVRAFPVIRQSALSAFDACALEAFFDETFGNYHTHPQGRGSIFHAVAAETLREMVRNDERVADIDMVHDILEQQLAQREPGPDGVMPVPMKEIAELRITTKKWALDNSFRIENIVSIEERYNHVLGYPDPVTGEAVARVVTGQPDLLLIDEAQDATVVDWKDTWGLPPESEISAGGFFQQRFYAMLVFGAYPSVQTVTLREFYPRYSQRREATIGREKFAELEAEFAALVERFDRAWTDHIESGAGEPINAEDGRALPIALTAFPPSPGAHCTYCKMPEHCPIMPEARGEGSITNAEQASAASGRLLVAKAIVKKEGASLRAWSRKTDRCR